MKIQYRCDLNSVLAHLGSIIDILNDDAANKDIVRVLVRMQNDALKEFNKELSDAYST